MGANWAYSNSSFSIFIISIPELFLFKIWSLDWILLIFYFSSQRTIPFQAHITYGPISDEVNSGMAPSNTNFDDDVELIDFPNARCEDVKGDTICECGKKEQPKPTATTISTSTESTKETTAKKSTARFDFQLKNGGFFN